MSKRILGNASKDIIFLLQAPYSFICNIYENNSSINYKFSSTKVVLGLHYWMVVVVKTPNPIKQLYVHASIPMIHPPIDVLVPSSSDETIARTVLWTAYFQKRHYKKGI